MYVTTPPVADSDELFVLLLFVCLFFGPDTSAIISLPQERQVHTESESVRSDFSVINHSRFIVFRFIVFLWWSKLTLLQKCHFNRDGKLVHLVSVTSAKYILLQLGFLRSSAVRIQVSRTVRLVSWALKDVRLCVFYLKCSCQGCATLCEYCLRHQIAVSWPHGDYTLPCNI